MPELPSNSTTSAIPPDGRTSGRSGSGADQQVSRIASLIGSIDDTSVSVYGLADAARPRDAMTLVEARLGVAACLFTALRCRHPATAAHSLRVALSCSGWAAAVVTPESQRASLEAAALLHDIGKIGVPDAVLLKPGRLRPEEAQVIDRHRIDARRILSSAGAPNDITETVAATGAWFDGTHPNSKLRGEKIPVAARMLSIADAYDSMTTDHVYRPAMSRERAITELYAYAGTQFDPKLVDSFCKVLSLDQVRLREDVTSRWLSDFASSDELTPWGWSGSRQNSLQPEGAQPAPFEQGLIQHLVDGVAFIDSQRRVLRWNTSAERLTGVGADAIVGRLWSPCLLEMRRPGGKLIENSECPVNAALHGGAPSVTRLMIRGRNDRPTTIDAQAVPIRDAEGVTQGVAVLFRDASNVASLEQRCRALHDEANRDPLTQVANRAQFDRALVSYVEAHLESGVPCSLIMTDIDHFKSVNDTFGHQAGDQAIIRFASLLEAWCRSGDLVCRYGGEEFAVLCADCTNAAASRRPEEIRRKLASTKHIELNNKSFTASFGVTELQQGDTADTLLRRADRALLTAKDQGRNQVVQLGNGMTEKPVKHSWWPFKTWRQNALIETTLVNNVPMEIAVQKLRGFIADHDAKILAITDDELRLEVAGRRPSTRRRNDRQIEFLIELQLTQERVEKKNANGMAAGKYAQTRCQTTIRPLRERDRRSGCATDSARMLLASLKSYLMANELHEETAAEELTEVGDAAATT